MLTNHESNINVLIGNGICNDEANNADCYYDGGDCCKFNTMPWNLNIYIKSTLITDII